MSIRAIEGGYEVTTGSGTTARIDADDIRRVANTDVGGALDRLSTALAKFRDLEEGVGGFGGSDPATELASLHAQVKDVFVSTSDGVRQDLDSFGLNLRRGADNWDAADQSSVERSRGLCDQIAAGADGPLAMQESYHASRQLKGEDLALSDEMAERAEQAQAEAGAGPGAGPGADLPAVAQPGVEAGEEGQ